MVSCKNDGQGRKKAPPLSLRNGKSRCERCDEIQTRQHKPVREEYVSPPGQSAEVCRRGAQQQNDSGEQGRTGHEISPGCEPTMLPDHSNFPEAILKILP